MNKRQRKKWLKQKIEKSKYQYGNLTLEQLTDYIAEIFKDQLKMEKHYEGQRPPEQYR